MPLMPDQNHFETTDSRSESREDFHRAQRPNIPINFVIHHPCDKRIT